ncbi:MAG: NUDIX domain-containing protein [Verrucomicrobia bacterium]|nr:NUDIX domain-containing protein [Verrucomicrobiota bacterium]
MIRNFIFDWSGTLVDDLPPVIDATNVVLTRFGKAAMDRETFKREFCLPFTVFYERVLPGVPLEELDPVFRSAFSGSSEPATIIPHAKDFLQFCKQRGCRMFVLSSAIEKQLREQAREAGIHDFFEHIYAGVLDKREKIHEILETHGLRPGETAFVGDMEHDIETARSAGVLSVAVLTGYDSREELSAEEPDIMANDLRILRQVMAETAFEPSPKYPIATVGALIFNELNQVLMIRTHKWSNRWGIPGGKIERGETTEEALRREIREETALEIDEIRFVIVQDCIEPAEFYTSAHFLLFNFTAKRVSGVVALNDEAEEFVWIDPQLALAELDLNQPTRTLLTRTLLTLEEA